MIFILREGGTAAEVNSCSQRDVRVVGMRRSEDAKTRCHMSLLRSMSQPQQAAAAATVNTNLAQQQGSACLLLAIEALLKREKRSSLDD
jgi:hypothetical protein